MIKLKDLLGEAFMSLPMISRTGMATEMQSSVNPYYGPNATHMAPPYALQELIDEEVDDDDPFLSEAAPGTDKKAKIITKNLVVAGAFLRQLKVDSRGDGQIEKAAGEAERHVQMALVTLRSVGLK